MDNVYFIGIGGIGMSALARYFHAKGALVAGYDLTPSPITDALIGEGIDIHFVDDPDRIPSAFRWPEDTLVVYTPAIPSDHREMAYFRATGFDLLKRSEILGRITRQERALCVAGTHGKTTTSTMLAHLLKQSAVDCNAFLGGIANNYETNLLLSDRSDLVVVEADEFDRSFHRLSPYMAIITSADPDHLDIYGTPEAYRDSFEHFTSLVAPDGVLLVKRGVEIHSLAPRGTRLYSYSADDVADYYADNVVIDNGRLTFDWHFRDETTIRDVELGVPLRINVENAVASMAIAHLCGVTAEELRAGMASFRGSRRRFDTVLATDRVVLIDDYAHHPAELDASVRSVRELYIGKKILGIFQPHLYSRTADFYREFAHSLDRLDETILIEIYPAREQPIPGVSSRMIADLMEGEVPVVKKEDLLCLLQSRTIPDVVLMVGAGDIDRLVAPVAQYLKSLC